MFFFHCLGVPTLTVMCDITGHMISEWVMKGILAPKPLPLADKLKDNFNQLAHSSIMKLGHDAMDKVGQMLESKFTTEIISPSHM